MILSHDTKIILAQSEVWPKHHNPSSACERAWTMATSWALKLATSTSTSSKFVFQIHGNILGPKISYVKFNFQ